MKIRINGQIHILPAPCSIFSILEQFCGSPIPTGVAIALNEEVVAQGYWTTTMVEDGDIIEILWASSGG